MKSKLYKKWLKKCKLFDDSHFSQIYKNSHAMYASELGDKFFEKYIKYSRLWHKIKVDCDLNGCTLKGIHRQDHPLHSYCPSVRLNNLAALDLYINSMCKIVQRVVKSITIDIEF